jgi:hypothetical protein
VRSTEGPFPYWLGVDDRLVADEFFRGSYTTRFWLKGEIATKFKYMAMFANNLSTLGVSAAQLDNTFDTQSYMLQWLPTTGEFGLWGTFGDYDYHEKLATRLAVHHTQSTEDKQSSPARTRSRTVRSASPTAARSSRRICSARVKREFFKDLFVGLSLYNTYDNRPPNPTANTNDVGVVVSIGWSY